MQHKLHGRKKQRRSGQGRLRLEQLEDRSLLTIYSPTGVTLAPSPVEGTSFNGALVGTFASTDPIGGLSASINWGVTATPTSSIGTITRIGTVFVPGVGSVPQYGVTGGTTFPQWTGPSSLPVTVTVSDSADSTNGVITSSTTVQDAPLTTTGGIASASVTEGASVTYTGAIALMTFTDGNSNSTAADFTAQITWGDGSPSTFGNITKAGSTYTVGGTHVYPEHTNGTPFRLVVQVSDNGGQTTSHNTSITVTDAALSGPTAIPIDAAEGQPLSNVALGTFLDGNHFATAADFSVSIDWGDGTVNDPGIATLVGGSTATAKFAVSGSHTYATAGGSPYPVTVTVTDSGGSTTTINTTATVTQTPLAVSVLSFNAVTAAPTASRVVATFFDAGGADPVGSYTATVNWGDGTSDDTSGAVTIAPVAGTPGLFSVTAPAHTYAAPGLYPITVSVNDSDPTSGIGNGLAIVSPASLIATPAAPINVAVEGQALAPSTLLAGFTSGDPSAMIASFTAIVDWGDGTPSTRGAISQPGGVGTAFVVTGGHTYADAAPGGYIVTVVISDAFNTSSVAATQVTSVADAPLTSGTPLPITAAAHQTLASIPVATFVDTNPGATSADFSASINWGDGSASDPDAQILLVGGNAGGAIFAIYGTHRFDASGNFSVVVTVNDKGGQSLTITPALPNAVVSPTSISVSALPETSQAGAAIPGGTVIGTFSAFPGADPIGQYSAVIDWGDGTTADTSVAVTSLGGTSFSVSTNLGHLYASPGTYALKLTVSSPTVTGIGANLVVISGTGAVLPILIAGPSLTAVEGTTLSNATVATFTDGNPGATVASYNATIDWGDGSPQSAGIVRPGAAAGSFVITGNHRYAEEGTFVVSIKLGNTAGNQLTASTTADVSDALLTNPAPVSVTTPQGVSLSNALLGTFIDGNQGATAADFSATINWGDGSPTSNGFVTLVGGSASGAVFSVVGSHAYSHAGSYTVRVTVGDAGGSMTSIITQATVQAAQINVAPGFPVAATEGLATPAGQVLATFTDGANIAPASTFTAMIDWGDGSATVPGTIAFNGLAYRVLAPPHTYAKVGTFVIQVAISDVGSSSSSALASNFAVVADAPLSANFTPSITGTQGLPFSEVVLGSFNDANPGSTVDDFLATISWGDGTVGQGTVSRPSGPGTPFVVKGSHTYADATVEGDGRFAIQVVVKDEAGQRLILTNTATVTAVPINISGNLDSNDDSGLSDEDGITYVTTPHFLGSSEPGSTIQLFLTSATGVRTLGGQGATGADGRFTVAVNLPLADGSYTATLTATSASGHSTASTTLAQPLMIDTVGPKILGIRFDRAGGRILVTLADDRSGLNQPALIDGADYQFRNYVVSPRARLTPLIVSSLAATAAAVPTDPQTVSIGVRPARSLSGGRFVLTISSAGGTGTASNDGLRDVAGNALDGEFYGRFASGNQRPGGDFVAGLAAMQRKVFAPVPLRDGYASPIHPAAGRAAGGSNVVARLAASDRKTSHAAPLPTVDSSPHPIGLLAWIRRTKNWTQ